jgi:hypothetical protein
VLITLTVVEKNIMNDLKTKLKQCEVHHSIYMYFGHDRTKVKQPLRRRSSVYSLIKIEVCMDGVAVGVTVGSKPSLAGNLGHASS